jgi:hypothetical protein
VGACYCVTDVCTCWGPPRLELNNAWWAPSARNLLLNNQRTPCDVWLQLFGGAIAMPLPKPAQQGEEVINLVGFMARHFGLGHALRDAVRDALVEYHGHGATIMALNRSMPLSEIIGVLVSALPGMESELLHIMVSTVHVWHLRVNKSIHPFVFP